MSKEKTKKVTFIDFALRILFEPDNVELTRLNTEWRDVINDPNPAVALRLFAKREGFKFTIAECQDALAFWNKFMEKNPNCDPSSGPVLY
jgi:hypothetical protein